MLVHPVVLGDQDVQRALRSRDAYLAIPSACAHQPSASGTRMNGCRPQRRAPAESSTALTARATVSGVKGFCKKVGGAVEGSAAPLP